MDFPLIKKMRDLEHIDNEMINPTNSAIFQSTWCKLNHSNPFILSTICVLIYILRIMFNVFFAAV